MSRRCRTVSTRTSSRTGTWWINNTGFLTGLQRVSSVNSCSTERRTRDQLPDRALTYTAADKSWASYWRHRNLRFHLYDLLAPSSRADDLLSEIDRDPTYICWANPNRRQQTPRNRPGRAIYRRHSGASSGILPTFRDGNWPRPRRMTAVTAPDW